MPTPRAVSYEKLSTDSFAGGSPTGELVFIAIPEPTFIALSEHASKRGMNVAQVLAQAIGAVLKTPQE